MKVTWNRTAVCNVSAHKMGRNEAQASFVPFFPGYVCKKVLWLFVVTWFDIMRVRWEGGKLIKIKLIIEYFIELWILYGLREQ